MQTLKHLIITAFLIFLSVGVQAGVPEGFTTFPQPQGRITSVFAIEHDPVGYVWMGTDNGLIRYDGFDYKVWKWEAGDTLSLVNNIVNALHYSGDGSSIYVGTDKGACIYDPALDRFRRIPGSYNLHVKDFEEVSGTVYAATTTGLVTFDSAGCRTVPLPGLPSSHVACITTCGDDLLLGAYDHLYVLSPDGSVDIHPLPSSARARNVLVLDIVPDKDAAGLLWIGTEQGLLHYDLNTRRVLSSRMDSRPVKTFCQVDDDLWMGTDNGLCIMDSDDGMTLYRHDVSMASSLPDDVVWAVSEDGNGNVWLGTDHGLALAGLNPLYEYISVRQLTGQTAGMDISVMTADDRGDMWFGGRNGLIHTDMTAGNGEWFVSESGGPGRTLSHNKVRALYDDGRYMWIASDGGLDIYDRLSGLIRPCHVTEPTGQFSSSWMYSIVSDHCGRIWLGTYDGGLFCIDRQKAIDSDGILQASLHFSTQSSPAVSGNVIRHLLVRGNELFADTGNAIDIISLDDMSVRSVRIPDNEYVISLRMGAGCIWAGTDHGLYRMEDDGFVRVSVSDMYVSDIMIYDDSVWTIGNGGLSVYDMLLGEWSHMRLEPYPLIGGMVAGGSLWLGTVDGVIRMDPEKVRKSGTSGVPVITSFSVNDEDMTSGLSKDMVLPHSCNSFTFSFSTFDYRRTGDGFLYRFKGFDDRWRRTSAGGNKASFINVPAGSYTFEVALEDPDVFPDVGVTSISLRIKPVWYATTLAYVIYVILGLCLCLAVFYYMRMRHQLQMEHAERERALRMADSKTEFLANISHEFKSPLSVILNFVGRLSASESDALKSREIQTVQKNAEKMHLLLNQMAGVNPDGTAMLFMPAPVSITGLARDVWDRYSQAFEEKGIGARFVADEIGYIFMADRVQMESALSNLLSNALKFTPRGGSVLMSVSAGEETRDMVYADIKVEDTGCGMRPEEMPLIFNRFYMAPSGQEFNAGGSGLGLDIVKDIVDRHKGRITVTSEPGRGSCFTVRLSTLKADSFILKQAGEPEYSLYSLSNVWRHDRRPIILLVEDNLDIRDLIVASLSKDYTFLMASEGGEALEILRTEKVDLVVTDIAMPGMDGLTMCRNIRGNLGTTFLPIIILTGHNDARTQMDSYSCADAFVTKPFDLNWLNSRIIQLLIRHEQHLDKMRQQKALDQEIEEVESPDAMFLQEMMDVIRRHMDDPDFSASVLGSESRWSEKQVYRRVKQLTGKTPTELIRDVRLEKAAMYLSQGSLTVMEVMYKVGFTTASWFSRCFREKYGVTPSDYRNGRE